jgi:DNA-binding transcriptional LysR family regulator
MQEVNFLQRELHAMHSVASPHTALRRLDLNLLLAFEALFRLGSVAAAAAELAMSPSAVSHALARLRATVGDELFMRAGNGMRPTPHAERLAEPVAAALELLTRGLDQARGFDPARSRRSYVLGATDYTAFAVLPQFVAHVQALAPQLRFKVVHSRARDAADELAGGQLDLALGYAEDATESSPGIEHFDLLSDPYVVIASQQHPTLRGRKLTLAQYLAERHVVVTPWNEPSGSFDKLLARQGLQRDVAVQLPSVLAAPFIVAHSALLMTVPRHAARVLQQAAAIRMFPVPFEAPGYTLRGYQHVKHSHTPAHAWLREQLLAVAPRLLGKP